MKHKTSLEMIPFIGDQGGCPQMVRSGAGRNVSVLFAPGDPQADTALPSTEPEIFHDLNLDQVVDLCAVAGREVDLKPWFWLPLKNSSSIQWRHQVFRDLGCGELVNSLGEFAQSMSGVRRRLSGSESLAFALERARWFLDAAHRYVGVVDKLGEDLDRLLPESQALRALRRHVADYRTSAAFRGLKIQAGSLEERLATVRFRLLIRGDEFTVIPADFGDADYASEIRDLFDRFKSQEGRHHVARLPVSESMNHIEAQVLEGVARLNPIVFEEIDGFRVMNRDFMDDTIVAFDREIRFYLGWLSLISPLEQAGLQFCLPQISDVSREEHAKGTFDIALASKLHSKGSLPVCNDWQLSGPERIQVVTGPNQGGKTTFARTYGQLHYLGLLGIPVAGSEAALSLCDRVLTHFDRGENATDLRGKLEDDLVRMRRILDVATSSTVLIVNEAFSSTTNQDALELSRRILELVSRLDLLCVFVTFLDELATFNEKTVSLVAAVQAYDPGIRTFKIEHRPADGRAHAEAIAAKYRLSHDQLKRRLTP